MKAILPTPTFRDQEPIGIVISRGTRHEHAPMVLAYVWGPAPDTSDEPADTLAI